MVESSIAKLEKPTGSVLPPTLSIKEQLNIQKKIQEQAALEQLRNTVSYDSLKTFTRKFAHITREAGMETFYHALIKREPLLDDECITIQLDNQVQMDYIKPILNEYLIYLKEAMKNDFIEVKLELLEGQAQKVELITGQDKFMTLAKRNPNLLSLKNRFNLDIEF